METTITTMTTATLINSEAARPIRTYLRRLKLAILHPTRFFREEFPALNSSEALAFGLCSAWAAAAVAFLFETANAFLLTRLFDRWVQRLLASDEAFGFLALSADSFLWNAGFLVLTPFLFLGRIFFSSLVVYTFARLFIEDSPESPEPVNFTTVLRISAVANAGQWFRLVPFFGGFMAFVAGLVLTLAGVRERFRVSNRRASLVVLAPYLLVGLMAFFLLALFALVLFQLPFHELLEMDPRANPFGF